MQPNRDVAAHWRPSAYAGDLSTTLALTARTVHEGYIRAARRHRR